MKLKIIMIMITIISLIYINNVNEGAIKHLMQERGITRAEAKIIILEDE